MGNREALIQGAKSCIRDKGFVRTTARDVASASGVSLAAIGYHFGSKEALLTQALVEATGEWIQDLEAALEIDLRPDIDPDERFELIWARLLGTFARHRPLLAANLEISPFIETMPEVGQVMRGGAAQGSRGPCKTISWRELRRCQQRWRLLLRALDRRDGPMAARSGELAFRAGSCRCVAPLRARIRKTSAGRIAVRPNGAMRRRSGAARAALPRSLSR